MKTSLLPVSLIAIALLLSYAIPPAVAAGPEALPPPTHADNAPPPSDDAGDNKAGLNKDLAPPTDQQGVQIRSYQKSNGTGITEYRMHGRLYLIKVQPANGMPAYYLYDSNGDGHFRRLPGNYKRLSPPMWVIKRF